MVNHNWGIIWCLLLFLPLFLAVPVYADTSSEVEVTAYGYICESPGDFTLTYVNDSEIGISWVVGVDAVNTMVRAAYGRVPEDITDGYQVYLGNGASCSDTALSLATPEVIYYRAWSQNAGGVWSNLFASGDTEGFMSASFLFIGLILIAAFLTWLARYTAQIMVRFAAALSWLGLGVWLLLGDVTNLSLADNHSKILAFVFILMTIVPFTWQMTTDIKYESHGKSRGEFGLGGYPGAESASWTEWGPKPKSKSGSSAERQAAYKNQLRSKRSRG